jgi:GTPase SAR1 family protein
MEMNDGKHETHIQGDVYGPVQGDQPQVTMHFHQAAPQQLLSARDTLNRQRLLAKVHAFWIKGVLEQSLHGAALIALGLEERRDVLADPWRSVLQQEGQAECLLPEGTHITQVFDEAVGELLILGEPGAGKTTLLLELARDLLERAEKDEHHPLPVVLNLSEWAVKRPLLTTWIIEELNSKYIERMQPDWLPDSRSRRGYHVGVGLLVGMILGMIVGSASWFALGGLRWLGPHALLLSVLIVGLLSGLRAGRRPAINPAEVVVWSWVRVKENMPTWLTSFLLGGSHELRNEVAEELILI